MEIMETEEEAMSKSEVGRSIKDVDDVIQLAKLDPEDFLSLAQSIRFNHELVDTDSVKLMEVPPDMADQIESGSCQIVIRGEAGESAVLCSSSQTFDLREAETSNSVLLLQNMRYPEQCKEVQQRSVAECQVTGEKSHTYYSRLLKNKRPRRASLLPISDLV